MDDSHLFDECAFATLSCTCKISNKGDMIKSQYLQTTNMTVLHKLSKLVYTELSTIIS